MSAYPPEAARLARQVVDIFSDPDSFPGRAIPPHIRELLGLDAAISIDRPPSPGPTASQEVSQEEKRDAA